MEHQSTTILKLALIHVGGLFAATFAIVTVIEGFQAVQMWRQARREGAAA